MCYTRNKEDLHICKSTLYKVFFVLYFLYKKGKST